MSVATALIVGDEPLPGVAEAAARQAIERAGAIMPSAVLLFLTPDFARHAAQAVAAVTRATRCLQVAGSIAAGIANERTWVFDRPAAAVMVFGDEAGLGADAGARCHLSLAGQPDLPSAWAGDPDRLGFAFGNAQSPEALPVWQHGRIGSDAQASIGIVCGEARFGISTGLRLVGRTHKVSSAHAYELLSLDGIAAAEAIRRELPLEYREEPGLPLHLIRLVIEAADGAPARALPILAASGAQSLTLGERLRQGDRLRLALRQPLDAERDLDARLAAADLADATADFGLYFSCIGRGPYLYGGEERDWQLFRRRFPATPFLGAYGHSQIAPAGDRAPASTILQNGFVFGIFSGKEPT